MSDLQTLAAVAAMMSRHVRRITQSSSEPRLRSSSSSSPNIFACEHAEEASETSPLLLSHPTRGYEGFSRLQNDDAFAIAESHSISSHHPESDDCRRGPSLFVGEISALVPSLACEERTNTYHQR